MYIVKNSSFQNGVPRCRMIDISVHLDLVGANIDQSPKLADFNIACNLHTFKLANAAKIRKRAEKTK